MQQIKMLFCEIHASMDGVVTYQELSEYLDDERVAAYFGALGLDTTDAWKLFKLLDTGSETGIDCEDFVEGCLRLRGPAKAMDIAKLSYDNQ